LDIKKALDDVLHPLGCSTIAKVVVASSVRSPSARYGAPKILRLCANEPVPLSGKCFRPFSLIPERESQCAEHESFILHAFRVGGHQLRMALRLQKRKKR